MAAAHTWWNLLLARFLLGFAVGAKSTTTPVYGAECAPANIRGALVMMWQMWTAFGIMLGFIASVAFMHVTHPTIPYFQWRLMLGSTAIPYVLSLITNPNPGEPYESILIPKLDQCSSVPRFISVPRAQDGL